MFDTLPTDSVQSRQRWGVENYVGSCRNALCSTTAQTLKKWCLDEIQHVCQTNAVITADGYLAYASFCASNGKYSRECKFHYEWKNELGHYFRAYENIDELANLNGHSTASQLRAVEDSIRSASPGITLLLVREEYRFRQAMIEWYSYCTSFLGVYDPELININTHLADVIMSVAQNILMQASNTPSGSASLRGIHELIDTINCLSCETFKRSVLQDYLRGVEVGWTSLKELHKEEQGDEVGCESAFERFVSIIMSA